MVLISAQLDGTLRYLQTASYIATIHGHFSGDKVKTPRLYDSLNTFKALLQDDLDLFKRVRLIYKPIIADSRTYLLLHALREIHSVRDRDY